VLKKILTVALFIDLGLWFGGSAYFSLFAAEELFAHLPIDAAGAAVGVLFPPFFTLMAILSIIAGVLFILIGRLTHAGSRSYSVGLVSVVTAIIFSLANLFGFLPRIEKIEAKMGPISTATAAMKQQFGMMHGISLLLDMLSIVLIAVIWVSIGINSQFQWSRKGKYS
jgi:hypothetical protein